MSEDRPFTTDPLKRLLRIGGLAGRVGASVLSDRIREVGRPDDRRDSMRTENLVKNAVRIVETLGELRGGAMKVGQMLSLHENLFPPEVGAVLSRLQKRAPSIPFEVIQYELEGALPDYGALFESLEEEAFAAASIGQVHRGVLRDGREVAVKIQYPLIDRIIEADLGNLKRLLERLFALFSEMDFEPFWQELDARLHEELDYEQEARRLVRMAELYADDDRVMIPRVVEEATRRQVLTMEYLPGIAPNDAASKHYPQELRDHWGAALLEFVLRGLFVERFLHADPNFANFAFREDGRIIVYDFGCTKELSPQLAEAYRATVEAALAGDRDSIPAILAKVGVTHRGEAIGRAIINPYLDLFDEIFTAAPNYRFGNDDGVYERIFKLGMTNLSAAREITVPEDMIFIDRTLAGHFGNLGKLRAQSDWRELMARYVVGAEATKA